MDKYLIAAGILIFIILFSLLNSYIRTRKLKEEIHSKWGKVPAGGLNDKIDSVSKYWTEKLKV